MVYKLQVISTPFLDFIHSHCFHSPILPLLSGFIHSFQGSFYLGPTPKPSLNGRTDILPIAGIKLSNASGTDVTILDAQ